MATYEYRCAWRHGFTARFPIGEAADGAPCPVCGTEAARVITGPALTRTPRRVAAAIDRAERSAEVPDVVSAVPQRRRPRRPVDPAHARLPRP